MTSLPNAGTVPFPADFEKALTSANLTEKQFKAFTEKYRH